MARKLTAKQHAEIYAKESAMRAVINSKGKATAEMVAAALGHKAMTSDNGALKSMTVRKTRTHRTTRPTESQRLANRAALLAAIREKHAMTKTTTLLVKEFPDYDVATLPVIPVGFVDSSWHNDACPSFAKGDLQLYVDYADPAARECGADAPRFVLVKGDPSDGSTKMLAASNEWADMLAAIEAAQ